MQTFFVRRVGITFLYFENIYNLTHRSKSLISNSFSKNKQNDFAYSTSAAKPNSPAPTHTHEIDLKTDKSIKNDNKNSEHLTKCWSIESFTVLETCSKCSSLLKTSLNACQLTGYREVLNCEHYGPVSRRPQVNRCNNNQKKSCPIPDSIRRKHYWTFEFVCVGLSLVFTTMAKRRKRYLDFLATERVRRQILSS